jgi:hypothetical protein
LAFAYFIPSIVQEVQAFVLTADQNNNQIFQTVLALSNSNTYYVPQIVDLLTTILTIKPYRKAIMKMVLRSTKQSTMKTQNIQIAWQK